MIKKSPENKNIYRIDQCAADGYKENHGHQVRVDWNGKQHSKFFRDSQFSCKEEGNLAAIKYRDELYKILEKKYGPRISGSHNLHRIRLQLPSNNRTGILGVNRSLQKQRNGNISIRWQTTYPLTSGNVQTRSIAVSKNGEIGALYKATEQRIEGITKLIGCDLYKNDQDNIQILVDRYLNMLVYLDELNLEQKNELIEIIKDDKIINTKKEDIILGRIGQKSFQDKLKIFWKNKCAVTGSTILLKAGHIKPWKDSNDRERLDVYNGILMSPNYDQAFDYGYISFNDDGKILIAQKFQEELNKININDKVVIDRFTPFHSKYLEHHRNAIFKSNAYPSPQPKLFKY